jgi:hypothetical protein
MSEEAVTHCADAAGPLAAEGPLPPAPEGPTLSVSCIPEPAERF